jgi:hypothetical protein
LDLNIEIKIKEILLQIEDCKKMINSIKDSIFSYESKLHNLDLKSINNTDSTVKNKKRLDSIISDRKSNLNLQIKKLDSLEEQHSNFTQLKESLLKLTPKLIGELYQKYIVKSNEKIIDPNLSLIKSDKINKKKDYKKLKPQKLITQNNIKDNHKKSFTFV